jgi:Leucine-rich repeat (LRR) protein
VPYLLNSDHDSRLNPSPKTILINYYGDYDDFFNYDYYSEDLPNILTKGIMEGDDFDSEKFIARVKTGKSPFKSGVKPSRILVENEIKKLAKKNKSGEGLKELDLKEKKLLKLPLAIFELESLEHLKLEGNKFTVLPKELGKLTNLKELNLRATNVEEIPASIAQLKNLEVLNLNYCHHLKRLPDAIGELTNLKKLTLWSFKGEIPESILKLTHLEELDINGMYNNHEKGLFDFPQWVCQLKGLKKLSISSNAFKSIPKEILNLSNLEVLNLNTALCCLEEPLPDLSQLKNLKELECGGRRLGNRPHPKQEILQNFFKISSLEILNIDAFSIEDDWMPNSTVEENRAALKDDPKKLAEFERRLRVNDSNQYYYEIRRQMTLEDFKGLDNLVHLRALDIRWNKLDALPKEVFSLKHLENLNIYGNNIAKEDMAALQKTNPDIRFSDS